MIAVVINNITWEGIMRIKIVPYQLNGKTEYHLEDEDGNCQVRTFSMKTALDLQEQIEFPISGKFEGTLFSSQMH